jgi:Domain of unknown function (DUF4915)
MLLKKSNCLENNNISLLVSCVGAYNDSGLGTGGFMLHSQGENYVIDHMDCTGLFKYDGIYYRFVRNLKTLIGYNENGICYTCKFPLVEDCHDIYIKNDQITFVSTGANKILNYNFKGKLLHTKALEGSGDAWHINSLELCKSEFFVTAFGIFNRHRNWNTEGCYEKGILYNLTKNEVEIDGLSGPHHPRFIDGKWFICDSHKESLRVYYSNQEYQDIKLGGFTRGFCYDKDKLYVGVNADRKNPNTAKAKIVILERDSLIQKEIIQIPFPEVYDLVFCDKKTANGIIKNLRTFQLSMDDEIIDGLKKQVEISEKTNMDLKNKLAAKPKRNLLGKLIKKLIN